MRDNEPVSSTADESAIHNRGQLVIFDLDGTLTDSAAGVVASFRHALATIGAEPPPATWPPRWWDRRWRKPWWRWAWATGPKKQWRRIARITPDAAGR